MSQVAELELPYVPTARQSQAHKAPERFVLYGGVVGALRGEAVQSLQPGEPQEVIP